MPYPNHALLVFGGTWTLPSLGAEIWTTSVRLNAGFSAGASWQALADEASTKVEAFLGTPIFASAVQCDFVKFNPIGTDGKYAIEDQTFVDYMEPPVTGTMGGSLLPLQNTIVVTTLTARTRGIASRGRMFLPGVRTAQIDSAGFVNAADAQAIADATAGFLFSLRLWNEPYNGVPAVVSQGANHGTGEGVAEPILGVTVGNVVDTQRRRRNALTPESRVLATILVE